MSRELANDIAKVALTKFASKKEVATYIRELIDIVKNTKKELNEIVDTAKGETKEEVVNAKKAIQEALDNGLKNITELVTRSEKQTIDQAYKTINREVYALEQAIKNVPQFDSAQIEAKFGAVIADLDSKLGAIRIPGIIEVRDGLEALPVGEQLHWTAVEGVVGIHVGAQAPEDKEMLWVDTR